MKKINLTEKSKKRLLIVLGVFVLIGVALLSIPKDAYARLFNKDINLEVKPETDERVEKLIYVMSKNDELVGLKIKVDEEIDDEILQKWDLLTTKVSSYPLGFYSPIETSTVLDKYSVLQNTLTLFVSEDFLNSDGKNALASIAWTFCTDEIDEVVIKVNNEKISSLKDYHFSRINRTINVNYIYETSYLFEADYVTIVHNDDDTLKPVTYFYQDVDMFDFIASKILDSEIIDNKACSYELENNELVVNLAVDTVLEKEIIDELKTAVLLNFDIDSLVINNNVMIIYEETFADISYSGGSSNSSNNIVK